MEAILAVMIVSISLTSFLCMLSYSELGQQDSAIRIDTDFIEDIEIENDRMICSENIRNEMYRFIERNDLNGAELKVSVAGDSSYPCLDEMFGERSGNNVNSKSGTFSIKSDDGRRFVAEYEVIYWWD